MRKKKMTKMEEGGRASRRCLLNRGFRKLCVDGAKGVRRVRGVH